MMQKPPACTRLICNASQHQTVVPLSFGTLFGRNISIEEHAQIRRGSAWLINRVAVLEDTHIRSLTTGGRRRSMLMRVGSLSVLWAVMQNYLVLLCRCRFELLEEPRSMKFLHRHLDAEGSRQSPCTISDSGAHCLLLHLVKVP